MYSKVTIAVATLMAALSGPATAEPIYRDSIDSNDLEFIRVNDPGVFACVRYNGRFRAEMPDTRHDELFADNVYTFEALFLDGESVGIWVHPDVGSRQIALQLALQAARPIGKLPEVMRSRLNHVVIHDGNETAFAEDIGQFFVLYSQNMAERIRNHDLEETVFFLSVHASLAYQGGTRADWVWAQRADGDFITYHAAKYTGYSGRNPYGEDMAESALFAWAVLNHPGRLPDRVEQEVRSIMPNRLAYFEGIFANGVTALENASQAGNRHIDCPEPTTSVQLPQRDISGMQRALMRHCNGLPVGFADGKFGPATRSVLKRFQKSHGLVPDGVYGPLSAAALDSPVTGNCR